MFLVPLPKFRRCKYPFDVSQPRCTIQIFSQIVTSHSDFGGKMRTLKSLTLTQVSSCSATNQDNLKNLQQQGNGVTDFKGSSSERGTTAAASPVWRSSIEPLQSRKVRGRVKASVSMSLPACGFHQRVHHSVTPHPPSEKTPAVFILKSHVGLWSITPCQEKAILIHSAQCFGCSELVAAYSACSSFACGFPISITERMLKEQKVLPSVLAFQRHISLRV